jgi:hypothetical protein
MLDQIVWGNPTQNELFLLEKKTILDKLFIELTEIPFPKNSSIATREELNQLVENIAKVKSNSEEYIKRYKNYDFGVVRYFAWLSENIKLDDKGIKLIDDLIEDIEPLVTKLKYHFQRPRPYQLAQAYKLKLFPYKTFSGNNPSYPSAFTLYANTICFVLGNHYPEHFNYFDSLAKDIAYSRLYMGLHYPSDNDFAIQCFDKIINDPEFKEKYNL